MFLHSPRFGRLTTTNFTLFALMNTESVYDIFLNAFGLNWLISQVFHYAFLFISILIIQNVFLIIIGDGYVKSKYFHKNNWVKAGDSGITEEEDGDDPLKPFQDKNPKAEASTKALVKMLKADKEILLTEYYQSKGLNYCPYIEEKAAKPRSPEHLTRLLKSNLDAILDDFNDKIEDIAHENGNKDTDDKEQEKDKAYDKAQLIIKALEHKLHQIKKE